jgi:hypothetical protein
MSGLGQPITYSFELGGWAWVNFPFTVNISSLRKVIDGASDLGDISEHGNEPSGSVNRGKFID